MQRYPQFCLRCAVLVAVLLWSGAGLVPAQTNNTLNRCRTIVAVGITKTKNVDANQVAQGLSATLSQGTEVQAVPVLNVSNEQALREQAARYQPDYLILVEAEAGKSTKDSLISILGCGQPGGIPCNQVKTVYKIKYRVEESASAKVVATTAKAVESSHENPQQAFEQVAVKLGEIVGGAVRNTVTSTPTFERLQRRAICYAGFPENPASIILKYDMQTDTKKVSFDQYIKGPLWRVSIRAKGAASPFISGYNGKSYWTLNRQEGLTGFTPTQNAPNAGSQVSFLAGEFLKQDATDNLKHEVARATLVAPETVNNRKCQVVEARTRADTYIRLCYDAASGALLKKSILSENREIVQESTFDDYREVAPGVRFPFVIYSQSAKGTAKIEFVEVRLNSEIPDAYFLRPANGRN